MSWQTFRQSAHALGVPLTSTQLEQFRLYSERLLAANRHINLTALRDRDLLIKKFHLDALSLLPVIARYTEQTVADLLQQSWSAVDVGSGGGAPALPLSIVWPRLHYTLIESIAKKSRFLEDVVMALGVNVRVINARAEEIGQNPQHRQRYDLVTARAVAALPTLAELTLPLARIGGVIALPKGTKAQAEAEAAAAAIVLLGGELLAIEQVTMPELTEKRMVVVMRKIADTPATYPRRVGVPARKPIKSVNQLNY